MGRVEIRVVEARNIGDVQKVGMPDPYVKVKVGPEKKTQLKYKTRVIDDCLNPVWNELFKFQIADPESMQVRFEVWNDNVFSDDLLGTYAVNLNALTRGVVFDTWGILQGTKLKTAELHLRILAVDFGKTPPPGTATITSIEQDTVTVPNHQVSRPSKPEDGYQQFLPPQQQMYNMPPHPMVSGGGMMGGFQATPPPPQWGYNQGPPQPGYGAQPAYAQHAYMQPGYAAPGGYAPPHPVQGYGANPSFGGIYTGAAPGAAPMQFAQGIPPDM